MRINHFAFTDLATGWQLEEAHFTAADLLVGISGVGKTKIVEAIQRVQRFAVDDKYEPGAMEWRLAFEHEGQEYVWEGATEKGHELGGGESRVVRERFAHGNDVVAERDGDSTYFESKPLPKLTRADTLLTLLGEEAALVPVVEGFHKFLFTEIYPVLKLRFPSGWRAEFQEALSQQMSSELQSLTEPYILNASALIVSSDRSLLFLLWLQQTLDAPMYREVKSRFIDIFPSVEDVRVTWSQIDDAYREEVLELAVRERGVDAWIPASEMSSGMRRTMALLLTTHFAPPGAVIIIDELENSLGVNCMSEVLDLLQTRSDCQFIATSHHPYIINNLPVDTWRLVRRHGNRVRIDPVASLPSFDAGSRHQAFVQLINLPEFEDGIA